MHQAVITLVYVFVTVGFACFIPNECWYNEHSLHARRLHCEANDELILLVVIENLIALSKHEGQN